MGYGYTIKAGHSTYSVSGCQNETWALIKCVGFAQKAGWTNPKWWQYWRWFDTRFSKDAIAFVEGCLKDINEWKGNE